MMDMGRIDQRLRVKFGMAIDGWLPVTIQAGHQTVEFAASYTPDDSLPALIDNLIVLLATDGTRRVTWYAEPIEYDFSFSRMGEDVRFTITEFADDRRGDDRGQLRLTLDTSPLALVLPFWRALRDVQSRATFEQEWQRPFPHAAMRRLTAVLQESKGP